MTTQSKRTVAFALCGSFCSFAAEPFPISSRIRLPFVCSR